MTDTDRAEMHRLAHDIDRGLGLPTEWFTNSARFEAELHHVHRRAWHFAAHEGQIAEVGDVLPTEIACVPVVLVRDGPASVRGFVNICRHRSHPVVLEPGRVAGLRCGYHGWTYQLDGSLAAAPRSSGCTDFDMSELGLTPIQVHVWGPTIWANLDPSAAPFAEWVAGLPEQLVADGLDVTRCRFAFDHEWQIDANWKVFQDNTIECYHCPTSHPELSRVLEMKPSLHEMRLGGPNWLWHRIPFRRGITTGLTYQAPEGADHATYHYQWIFPTTYLQHAGRGFDIGSVRVLAPDKIRFHHICFMPDGTPADVIEQGRQALAVDPTIGQDVEICHRVQASHRSRMAQRARILSGPEMLVRAMNRRIVEMMATDDAVAQPLTSDSKPL